MERSHVRSVRWMAALALAAFFSGCAAPNRQYQAAGPISIRADREPFADLRAIEFDEQGNAFDQQQTNAASAMLHTASGRPPLLVVFIHGWHNNAAPENGNLASFNQLLKGLVKSQVAPGVEIKGVYIGWRGLAIDRGWDKTGVGWAARYLSFYSRKRETDKVAEIQLTQALQRLCRDAHQAGGRVILIGHSFGARILEKVIGHILVAESGSIDERPVVPPADLTLLLNPASEAQFTWNLKTALSAWQQPQPAIVSVTSTGDHDTGTFWTLGMSLSTTFEFNKYRNFRFGPESTGESQPYVVSERDLVTHTAGHFPRLVDREVEPLPGPAPTEAGAAYVWDRDFASWDRFRVGQQWYQARRIASSIGGPAPGSGNRAPGYSVMTVPPEIIADHNAIFTPETIDLVVSLYKICAPTIQKPQEAKVFRMRKSVAPLVVEPQ